jgi:sec-independent protein translocase protein TatA
MSTTRCNERRGALFMTRTAVYDRVDMLVQAAQVLAVQRLDGGCARFEAGLGVADACPGSGVRSERLVGPTGSVAYMNLGITELLIVLVILVVLFGAVKLPKLARSLGQSRNEFKRGLSDDPEPDDGVRPPD